MRLIDADALKEHIDKLPALPDGNFAGNHSALKALINMQPTIEPKKGKWILVKGSNGKDYHKCSECLHTQDITGVKNYCAVCGADMRGEENA